jgi:hypothetical protein
MVIFLHLVLNLGKIMLRQLIQKGGSNEVPFDCQIDVTDKKSCRRKRLWPIISNHIKIFLKRRRIKKWLNVIVNRAFEPSTVIYEYY